MYNDRKQKRTFNRRDIMALTDAEGHRVFAFLRDGLYIAECRRCHKPAGPRGIDVAQAMLRLYEVQPEHFSTISGAEAADVIVQIRDMLAELGIEAASVDLYTSVAYFRIRVRFKTWQDRNLANLPSRMGGVLLEVGIAPPKPKPIRRIETLPAL